MRSGLSGESERGALPSPRWWSVLWHSRQLLVLVHRCCNRLGDRDGRTCVGRLRGSRIWLDIYAGSPWSKPERGCGACGAGGVQTLYLQTSNYSRSADVMHPAQLQSVRRCSARGRAQTSSPGIPQVSQTLAWTPAGLWRRSAFVLGPAKRSTASRSTSSKHRPNVAERNARLLSLARLLRRASPAGYPLGAIIPSPGRDAASPALLADVPLHGPPLAPSTRSCRWPTSATTLTHRKRRTSTRTT